MNAPPTLTRIPRREAGVVFTLLSLLALFYGGWASWVFNDGLGWHHYSTAERALNFVSMFWPFALVGVAFGILGIWLCLGRKNAEPVATANAVDRPELPQEPINFQSQQPPG